MSAFVSLPLGQSVPSTLRHLSNARTRLLRASVGVVSGLLLVTVVVTYYDIPLTEAAQIGFITVSTTGMATVCGAAVLYLARRRSIATQAGLLAFVAIAGAGLGAWATAQAMFLSPHDFAVLMVVLTTTGVAVLLGALVLGYRVQMAAEDLVRATRSIDGSRPTLVDNDGHPAEMALLARELRLTANRLADEQIRVSMLQQSRLALMEWISDDLNGLVEEIERLSQSRDASAPEKLQVETRRMRSIVSDLLELNHVNAPGESSVVRLRDNKGA